VSASTFLIGSKMMCIGLGISNVNNKMAPKIVGCTHLLSQLCLHQEIIHASAVHFNQSSMRKHLHCSLNNDNLFPFPISRSRRAIQQFTRHIINVPVYCYCRMPEIFSSRMIQCDNCSSWFHINWHMCES
jgi:hypothetical protein